MYDAGPRWNQVQWIEFYNSSMTQAINLKGWELEIRNADDDVVSYVNSSFIFNDAIILPNQTLLLISRRVAANDVPRNRVYNLYKHHRRELDLTGRRSVLLGPTGFYLKLTDRGDPDVDADDRVVDEVGNLKVDGATLRKRWELPPRHPEYRQSLLRQYGVPFRPNQNGVDGVPDFVEFGILREAWRRSEWIGSRISYYYGHRDDVSTPGYRLGGPLPVQLSSFRAEQTETGGVVISWTTASELNNAGFNILRSKNKNGEFKVVNVKGIIAGHGTSSEKHTYSYTDTTAKRNVIYYYQIEDVSFDGVRQTLATVRLRGQVSASGKLTMTWGHLKRNYP